MIMVRTLITKSNEVKFTGKWHKLVLPPEPQLSHQQLEIQH